MKKEDLVKGLKNELKKMLKRANMIDDIAKIDLTKFEGKKLTKHILTHMEKNTDGYHISYREIGSLKYIQCTTKPENHYYSDMVSIDILFYQGDNFTVKQFNDEMIKWKNTSNNTLVSLANDIKNIDDIITLYNNSIDAVEKFQKTSSYKTKEIINYQYSYNHKILK